MQANYHLAFRRSCRGCGQFTSMVAAHQEYVPGPDKEPCECDAIKAERLADEHLGWVARVALAGAWHAAVEARDRRMDTERLRETERLMAESVYRAAAGRNADAIDAARSALACCPDVPELAADVARIVAILEAS